MNEQSSRLQLYVKSTTLLLVACFTLGCANVGQVDDEPLPAVCSVSCITPYGEVLGKSPSGVAAYSNCSAGCVSKDPNQLGDVYTGMEWQCVEFARRWLYRTQGLVFESVDFAHNIWDGISYLVDVKTKDRKGLRNLQNGSTEPPRRGDMLIWSSDYLGTGHVAIVTRVDYRAGYVEVAEQNFYNQEWPGSYARRIPLQQREGGVWLEGAYLLGWKRLAE
jgi:glutathionylspermidine amidase/synthetase